MDQGVHKNRERARIHEMDSLVACGFGWSCGDNTGHRGLRPCLPNRGEWHSSALKTELNHDNLAAIVAKILEVLPENRMTQVRVPKYKRWVQGTAFQALNAGNAFTAIPAARIGFHNDGLLAGKSCGGTWTEKPFFSNPDNPEFDYMTVESPFAPVDGELFWSEMEGKRYGIDVWRKKSLRPGQVAAAKLPMSDGYFEDTSGRAVARTQFEYIRDHLGYRIELQEASWPENLRAGMVLKFQVALINRGFSTLINPRTVYLALLNTQGKVAWTQPLDTNVRGWQPLPQSLPAGSYIVGLWLPDASESIHDDARYAVRVANRDVPWWTASDGTDGINLLGPISITAARSP